MTVGVDQSEAKSTFSSAFEQGCGGNITRNVARTFSRVASKLKFL